MSTAVSPDRMQGQLPMETVSVTHRFEPGMFILNRSVEKKLPLLAQFVTWRNSVDLFREQEKKDFRNLYHDLDHRSFLSALIGTGEILLCHAKMQGLALDTVGLTFEMVESEIRALRDDMRITHEELISEDEAKSVLSVLIDAKRE